MTVVLLLTNTQVAETNHRLGWSLGKIKNGWLYATPYVIDRGNLANEPKTKTKIRLNGNTLITCYFFPAGKDQKIFFSWLIEIQFYFFFCWCFESALSRLHFILFVKCFAPVYLSVQAVFKSQMAVKKQVRIILFIQTVSLNVLLFFIRSLVVIFLWSSIRLQNVKIFNARQV